MPRPLKRHLQPHAVTTTQERGWAGVKNGALLRLLRDADADPRVTTDRNLEYQQNVATTGLAVIVLVARTNTFEDLVPLVPTLLDALGRAEPGHVTHVGA